MRSLCTRRCLPFQAVRSVALVVSTLALLVGLAPLAAETESPYGDSSCVEYDREGEMYLVRNDCESPDSGCTRQLLDLEEAIEAARRYRWIDVSASMKRPGHALWEAELKLLGIGGRGLVMIYLPQGVDEINCGGTGLSWVIEAIRLYGWEHYPVDHDSFQEVFSELIGGATEGGRQILVTTKSYGAHQALEVFHDNPDVFHLSIGPSFGIFKDTTGDRRNPHVDTYLSNLEDARCKMCIVSSFNDCWSLYAFGSALDRQDEAVFRCTDSYNPEHPNNEFLAEVPEYCYDSIANRHDCETRGLLPPPRAPMPTSTDCLDGDSSCYVYGNLDTHEAIYDNRENIETVLAAGAGHYTPSYYDHGLVNAMRSCPEVHGLADSNPIADLLRGGSNYLCRDYPSEIVVDDLVGRDVRCGNSLTFRVENFECQFPTCGDVDVQVFVDGVLRETVRNLEEGEEGSVTVSGERVSLKARCGSRQLEKRVFLDTEAPTFASVNVVPNRRQPGSFTLVAEGVDDDGYWTDTDYTTEFSRTRSRNPGTRRRSPRPYSDTGRSITLENLSPGVQRGSVWIVDGCRRRSLSKSVSFTVDEAAPSLSFVLPANNAQVTRGRDLAIEVEASAGSGITDVAIYLDRISEDEFDFTKICHLAGVFGRGRAERKRCAPVEAAWSPGQHTLIAVARSGSGLQTTVRRTFRVR